MSSVVITGCNRGLGEGIADVLLEAGYHVIGWNRTPSSRQAEHYHEAACDIRSADAVARAAPQLPDDTAAVVANAGVRRFAPIDRLAVDDWKDSVETNLSGVFYLARATLPLLRKNRGYFVVVGSHAEKYPFEQGAAYCATKSGLRGLVDCLIAEARHDGVRATHLSLGSIKNREHGGDEDWKLLPGDVGQLVLALLRLPENMLVPYLDARPLMPLQDDKSGIERLQYV
jgi:NAD(P)-dependent dehydrogenase (short-subunit alcohol dehydrogenase family)